MVVNDFYDQRKESIDSGLESLAETYIAARNWAKMKSIKKRDF